MGSGVGVGVGIGLRGDSGFGDDHLPNEDIIGTRKQQSKDKTGYRYWSSSG